MQEVNIVEVNFAEFIFHFKKLVKKKNNLN